MSDTVMTRPRVYIEERFPIDLLNQQVQLEMRGSPFTNVHRWFSRKPLSFSRASVLASVLPATVTPEDFCRLMAMPPNGRQDVRLYQQTPPALLIEQVKAQTASLWGEDITLLDSFAGGGSIPFEAVRYGINTLAYDLNSVAVATMKAAIEVPLVEGHDFVTDLNRWVGWVGQQAQERLQPYFTSSAGERTRDYLWAHTATCEECALTMPLSPTWWVNSSPSASNLGKACAVRLVVPSIGQGNVCSFQMERGRIKNKRIGDYDPAESSTLAHASGRCPRCRAVLTTENLMKQAQAGGLGYQMYAVVYFDASGALCFRTPAQDDLDACCRAEIALQESMSSLLQKNLVPDEVIPDDTQRGPDLHSYGLYAWRDLYNPRQLLSLTTLLDIVQEAVSEYGKTASEDKTVALALWLSMALDRCVDMNSRLSNWIASTIQAKRASATHSLNLMWNFPEINGATRLWQLCAETVTGDYDKLCQMVRYSSGPMSDVRAIVPSVHIAKGDAANLDSLEDKSVTVAVTDPPYYSAIRYAEIADMYYVWERRALGDLLSDLYADPLSNKEMEAIANSGRFRGLPNAAALADRDYETKLSRAFAEYHRVLRDDGVLTVQFNHKDSGAWDILSQTLINAGFEITATWAVNTESPTSLHQAEKNAVNSTVLLVCRKRINVNAAWWEDVQPKVREAVMGRVPELEAMGMKGIDLYLAAFGPALQVLSRNWPVRDRNNTEVRPEAALTEARHAVVDQRMSQMTEGRYVQLDPISRFYLITWDCFLARQFSFDEGRLLALSTGDVDIVALRDRYRLLEKKGGDIVLLTPQQRVRLGAVNVRADNFATMVDALHAALALYIDDGITAVQRFFERTNLFANPDFVQFVELALKMLPPATEEHKALTDLLLSDVKLRGAIQIPLFEDVEAQTHEQPRLL